MPPATTPRSSTGRPPRSDFTLADLRTALLAIVAHLPVYRTYVTASGIGEEDRRYLGWAVTQARRDHPQLEGSLFRFVHGALRADLPTRTSDEYLPQKVLRFAMKSQQLSGAVAAKGVEDTAFYRYNRLISLNEVGGDPARFGISPAAFHHMNVQRLETHPYALLTTASHDHKQPGGTCDDGRSVHGSRRQSSPARVSASRAEIFPTPSSPAVQRARL